jgi:ATP-dependent DNA helicase RecG
MVLVPEQVIQWLKDKLPNPIDRSGAERREMTTKFYELVREGVVNALIHRDYEVAGAKCQLSVTSDAITIKSPGGPIEPITLGQLQAFNAPMLSRNPVLHYVFAKMELAEERGLGLKSMKARASEIGLPLPRYSWEAPYLVLKLLRSPAGAVRDLVPEVRDRLNDDESASWEFIAGKQTVTTSELMERMSFDERKAQRVLKKLHDVRLLRRVGRGPATHYEVVQP